MAKLCPHHVGPAYRVFKGGLPHEQPYVRDFPGVQDVEMCVWDEHPGRPVIQQPHQFDTSGRGLILVQAFASGGCGWFELGTGKVVWARIAIDHGYMLGAARRAGCPIVGTLRHVVRPRAPLHS